MLRYILLLSLFGFVACGPSRPDEQQQRSSDQVPVMYVESASHQGFPVAELHVKGMMCEKACGGKIQQELRALKGVSGTALDYADDRESNAVRVTFDPVIVSPEQLIACVQSIADGSLYTVSDVVVSRSVPSEADMDTDPDSGEKSSANIALNDVFRAFNILQTIRQFLY